MVEQKKNDLTSDDLYCIEQALDKYGGDINNSIAQFCAIGARYGMDVVGKELTKRKSNEFHVDDNRKTKNPMDVLILDLMDARERIKKIRDKLEKKRLSIR